MTSIDAGAAVAASAPPAARWGDAWRRPPALAAATIAAAAAIARFGATPRGAVTAFFVAVLVLVAVIDLEKRVLPNAIVLPSALLVLVMQIALEPERTREWLLAALGAAGCLFVLFLVNPAGMGMGDVKLALLLGAGLGARVIPAFVLASLAVWPLAFYLMFRHGTRARKASIAFGPFLAFGAIVVALVGAS